MWQVVYIVSRERKAMEIKETLEKEGFLVAVEKTDDGYQIKVPAVEAEEVYDFLSSNY